MDRSNMLLVGLGGAGGKLTDAIMDIDQRFQGYFINTSITDIESLNNYNPIIKNGYCTSTANGVGRKRELGKELAKSTWLNVFDNIQRFTQPHICISAGIGGGSGGAELSIMLEGIDKINEDEDSIDFNKKITLILILPSINSPSEILQNAIDTWSEISKRKCITNIIFIDNDSITADGMNEKEKEILINNIFAEGFDSIFDIPEENGTNFDEGNLGNFFGDKGCIYFYNLSGDYDNIEKAMSHKEDNSVLAKMYVPEDSMSILADCSTSIKCARYGISFSNENYNKSYIYKNFSAQKECYEGDNAYGNNILLLSGLYPPMDTILSIEKKLDKTKTNDSNFDFSKFTTHNVEESNTNSNKDNIVHHNSKAKKKMKKNLFK